MESSSQTRRVFLNLKTECNPRKLAEYIEEYFKCNDKATEVIFFGGGKEKNIYRNIVENNEYFTMFMNLWNNNNNKKGSLKNRLPNGNRRFKLMPSRLTKPAGHF